MATRAERLDGAASAARLRRRQGRQQAALLRYTRAVRWMKVTLPLGALAMVGAIFLLGRSLDGAETLLTAQEIAQLSAGMKLDNPRFAGRTAGGEPYVLRASWARPDGAAPTRIGLSEPSAEIRLEDGRLIDGRSDTGIFFRTDEILRLDGTVTIETSDGYRFETERLDINIGERKGRSPGAVEGTGPQGSIEAGAMRFVDEGAKGTPSFFFDGGVRVVFIPEASR